MNGIGWEGYPQISLIDADWLRDEISSYALRAKVDEMARQVVGLDFFRRGIRF